MTAQIRVLCVGIVALLCGACAEPPPFARLGSCDGALPNRVEIAPEAVPDVSSSARRSLVIAIDMSSSMSEWAGYDVDADGKSGLALRSRWLPTRRPLSRDADDTVLGAQLAAVERALGSWDPSAVRIGLIGFGGDVSDLSPDVLVLLEPTSSRAALRLGLERIRTENTRERRTNLAEAVFVAGCVLERSSAPASKRVVVLTDGFPTAPLNQSIPQNRRLALAAAAKVLEKGIQIDVYGMRLGDRDDSEVLRKLADLGKGTFHLVTDLKELGDLLAADPVLTAR